MRVTVLLSALVLVATPLHGHVGGVTGDVTADIPVQTSQPGPPTQPGTGSPQRGPARPLRPGETPPKGTAVIKGQVRMSGTGAAVRRTQIRAQSMDGRGGGVTSTDSNGLFEIRDLPAGRYIVVARKAGYAEVPFGQRRAGEQGTPIELADGQIADKVNFVLMPGGVIAGTIVDDGGDPIAGAQVSAMRYQYMAGTRRLMPPPAEGASDRTDDRGQFRLFGLPPGDYYVSGTNVNYRFMPPGATNTEQDGFAPTYYPGTANVTEATRITLKAGQEMSGANFALIVARMARVRGRVVTSRGEPAAGSMAMLAPGDPFSAGMMNMSNAVIGTDGTFTFANVAPGRYNLNIRPGGGMQNPNGEFAVMPLTVGNDDIDNLLVTTHTGAIARGVVTTDDGSPPPFRPEQVQLFVAMVEPMAMMMNPGMSRIHDDYTFEMTGLSGTRRFNASVGAGLNPTWYLKAVLYDGQDITDFGVTFEPARTYDGVTVVFTQRATDLSGAISDDRNRPVLDATVVIFPANRERWHFQSRYIRTLRPDTNGRFSTKNLPPSDDYLIIAVQNLEQGQGSDPEFLARAVDEAKTFSLNEGEIKAVDIKLSTLVP
jgi:hypothetical protein